jgi:CubicO group peptidase (beta-lactamase class C family)
MSALAGLIAAAGLDAGLPVALASVDSSGKVEQAVAGHWRDGRPVGLDDRFYGASLAKQLTGAAVALLVREGRLDPDAPVSNYLDGLPTWGGAITARQLAHHTSSLADPGFPELQSLGDWTEAVATSCLVQLETPADLPGAAHRYSNLGYILLARLVARVSGMLFAEFIAAYIWADQDMGFTAKVEAYPQAAYLGRLPLTQGDGGLWTTAVAFARWLAAQNRDPLRLAAIVEAPGRLNDGTPVDYGWGLGLRHYRGERLLIHGGGWTGATAKAVRCPALGIAAVALTAGGDMQQVVALADAALDLAYSSSSSADR